MGNYCRKCAQKTEGYKLRFCSHCGASFLSEASTPPPSKPKAVWPNKLKVRAAEEDEGEEIDEIPDISQLSFNVVHARRDNAITFKELAEAAPGPKDDYERPAKKKGKKLSKKQILEDFKREAGNSTTIHEID